MTTLNNQNQSDTIQTFCIELLGLSNFKPPPEIAQKGDVVSHLQIVANLHHATDGFIGRSYIGLAPPENAQKPSDQIDYVVFNTKTKEKLSVVIEYMLICKEVIQKKEESKEAEVRDFKKFGLGYCAFDPSSAPSEVALE